MSIKIPFKKIETYVRLSILIWIILQVIFVYIFWDAPQYSDARVYTQEAINCYSHGEWYPNVEQINNSRYIFNPGYINYLILQLNIFGSLSYNGILGIFLNILLLRSVFCLIKRIVNIEAAYWGVILFCIMSTNIVSPVLIMSELLFTALLFLSFALITKKYWMLVLSAIFLCLANYVRPIMILFALPLFLIFFFNKFKLMHYLTFLGSFILSFAFLNFCVRENTSAKDINGTTLGVNLIMAANDDANGAYNDVVFKEGKIGYLEKNLIKSEHSVYDYVFFDSEVERDFATNLEKDPDVILYAKLPRWFKINTPLGGYNPDWAILLNDDGSKKMYFVIETKGNTDSDSLRFSEKAKIDCGKKHFNALETGVNFAAADSYNRFKTSID